MTCTCASAEKYKVELLDIVKHNHETYSLELFSPHVKNWSEGDSAKLFLRVGEKEIGKKFSFATLPHEYHIKFTTRIRDIRSTYKDHIAKLKKGDILEISKPEGDFKLRREHRPIFLLSNGVGIAAVRGLVKSFELNQMGIPQLIQVNVDKTDFLYKKEFDTIEQRISHFKSHYMTNRQKFYQGLDHIVQEVMKQEYGEPYFYVVGSDQFLTDSMTHLKDVGFTDEHFITDGRQIKGSCGCASTDGCGCGGNTLIVFDTKGKFVLPTSQVV